MFNKKKKTEEPKKEVDFTNWEKDFGFLMLIISRKKNITKEFFINVYNRQKDDKDYITDEELEPIITKIVTEVLEQIGDTYKDFLIEKYFGKKENLISFISEDVYVDLISDVINRNTKKISTNIQKKIIRNVGKMNSDKS